MVKGFKEVKGFQGAKKLQEANGRNKLSRVDYVVQRRENFITQSVSCSVAAN